MKIIFSADENWGIGRDNKLLFRTKGDMAYFKSKTTGKIVVMGRSTLESLPGGRPLPNRTNIVLSSQKDYAVEGAEVCCSLEELLGFVLQYPTDDVFVIGGETVYRMLLPYCDTAYITRFYASAQADRFMPDFDALPEWRLTGESEEMIEDGLRYKFLTYTRDNPNSIGRLERGESKLDFDELYKRALGVAFPFELSGSAKSGEVGAAILTESGNVYTGVCVDTDCSMGFCAEHAAAAAMLTAHENVVVKVVAVNCDGYIMPPCGRCREFLSQLSDKNMDALVMVSENTVVKLRDLLPYDWRLIK